MSRLKVISYREDPDQYERIRELAKAEDMTVSQYVRRAVKWALILRGARK